MFGRIARRYDAVNSLMTFGRDRFWRRFAIKEASLSPGDRLLDAGTGTGALAREAGRMIDGLSVVAADFSPAMLAVGRKGVAPRPIQWCLADALSLPFPDASFDAVVSGFLVRNVEDVTAALDEQYRILKPRGRVVILDTSPPPASPLRPLITAYLRLAIPALGTIVARDGAAYTYLPASTQRFKTPEELGAVMEGAGFTGIRFRRFMGGTIAVHRGRRPREG
jgi:demethylmenaquinone methyltransferase/2-methoxy-6-polyprenyl-1,4-benzoquinol methylase